MRLALAAFLVGVSVIAQQTPRLTQFLALNDAQVASVRQLNDALSTFVQNKNARENTVQQELTAEYAKLSPDSRALGQRYIEIDSIDREIPAERTNVQNKVVALLSPAQTVLVQRISSALVQQSLIQDAACAYLTDAILLPPGIFPIFDPASGTIFRLNSVSPPPNACGFEFPLSIRDFLGLADLQVPIFWQWDPRIRP